MNLIARSPNISTDSGEPFSTIRAKIERLVTGAKVPSIAVAVARDGQILWEQGFAMAGREKNIPTSGDDQGGRRPTIHASPGTGWLVERVGQYL
ncbi:MAG: hypothetical protein JSV89_07080 [Spirochaetaceae bacterium]|nr:MAG: hypothetical protein JSV89_07080 [Spirochaetaceae bacterium]